ncbi:hypothetical protein SAY86_012193 [Trapa natans]|uniref:Uncharacterized protein n=1 Tax=Trapa natans TaxID=22666 RepID=A0AAN7LXL1_TRANT|nr:hypothetical protein SAY86_012193 [Trapa natans]
MASACRGKTRETQLRGDKEDEFGDLWGLVEEEKVHVKQMRSSMTMELKSSEEKEDYSLNLTRLRLSYLLDSIPTGELELRGNANF